MANPIKGILKNVWFFTLKLRASFYPVNKTSLFFLPHRNSMMDNYDVSNYSADNVLVLLNHVLRSKDFAGYTLYIGYYNGSSLDVCQQYVRSINKDAKVVWVDVNSKKRIAKALIQCRVTFTDHPHLELPYKSKKQKVISLGYFTPFKDDYWDIEKLSPKERNKLRSIVNKSYDYHIVTSSVSGRIISVDTLLEYDKFKSLGFPRNDIFYKDNVSFKEQLRRVIGMDFDKVICYTPTYRDYEREDLYLSDKSLVEKKGVFGNIASELSGQMDEVLKKNNSIVIAKMHPWQEKSVLEGNTGDRIFMFSDIAKKIKCSLYDVLSISDALITDYTSTAFDYMHLNKPIIFYFYDYEKYTKNRGFSFEPVETVCGGPIVYNYEDLIDAINFTLAGGDNYENKRQFVHSLINEYHDGKSCERISILIKELTDDENKCCGNGI